jgi:uroporphyrinogen decarboxylase
MENLEGNAGAARAAIGGEKAMLRVLAGEVLPRPPVWIMRQAGRYLPEYREIRARAKSFLDFCYSPALACEAVLQPLRRFDLDAAILFSDILVVPDGLGRKVWFVEGEGPRLDPLMDEDQWRFDEPEKAIQRLAPVYETVERIKGHLPAGVALIGFAGAPWTVATYMLQGEGGEKDRARRVAYQRPEEVGRLLDVLVEVTAQHLAAQVRAGAEILQIFESWAEGLPPNQFEALVLRPTEKLLERLKGLGVTAPVIAFPRGCGGYLKLYSDRISAQAIGVDTGTSPSFARAAVANGRALQGNLDPQLLVVGGDALSAGVDQVLEGYAGAPHIFNLGHGITPQAQPENVAALVARVKRAVG